MDDIKFEDWRLNVFWAAVSFAALIAGFVFGWGWRDRSDALAGVSLLNVITALGTVGAVIAAVYLAGAEQRRREQERRNTAAVMSYLFAADLQDVRNSCREIVVVADQIAETHDGFVLPHARVFLNQLAQLLEAPAIDQNLVHWNCFSGSTPATIAELMGNLPRLQRSVEMIATHEAKIDDSVRKFARSISRDAKNILRLTASAGLSESSDSVPARTSNGPSSSVQTCT